MAKKNFEVCVTARTTVLVLQAESEKQAYEFAREELGFLTSFEDVEMSSEEIDDDSDIETYRRHAGAVSEPR